MSGHPPSEPYRGGDYEYDEAHASAEAAVQGTTSEHGRAPQTYVATQTPDYDGDYSYDLAHDASPGTGR